MFKFQVEDLLESQKLDAAKPLKTAILHNLIPANPWISASCQISTLLEWVPLNQPCTAGLDQLKGVLGSSSREPESMSIMIWHMQVLKKTLTMIWEKLNKPSFR